MLNLLKVLLGIILLIFIVPLLWLLIKMVIWFFRWLIGGLLCCGLGFAAGDVLGVLFIVACVVFVIWCIFS